MKVEVVPITDEEVEEAQAASDAGLIPDATPEEMKAHLLSARTIQLSEQAAQFFAEELGMTPDEAVAYLLKQAGATQ